MFRAKFLMPLLSIAFVYALIGCSSDTSTVSVKENNNALTATVGTSGASFVAATSGYPTYVISRTERWSNGSHKIFCQVGSAWQSLYDYSHIDAWKVAFDPGTGELWVIARDSTVWKGVNKQYFTTENNPYGKTGEIKALDLSMSAIEHGGNLYAQLYTLINEPEFNGEYGYVIWSMNGITGSWDRFRNTQFNHDGSGLAIATNPAFDPIHGNELWVVRNNNTLVRFNCSTAEWVVKAEDCLGTDGKADVSVTSDNYVYYLTNSSFGKNYRIKKSNDYGEHWYFSGSGIGLGAADKGWAAGYYGALFQNIYGTTWLRY